MNRVLLIASLVMTGFVVVTASGACGGDDSDTPGAGDAANNSEASTDPCSFYTGAGKACSPISEERCFPLCTIGGSYCRASPDGGGVWVDVDDETCYPDGAPNIDVDSGTNDIDGGTTVTDASDASDGTILDAAGDGDAGD